MRMTIIPHPGCGCKHDATDASLQHHKYEIWLSSIVINSPIGLYFVLILLLQFCTVYCLPSFWGLLQHKVTHVPIGIVMFTPAITYCLQQFCNNLSLSFIAVASVVWMAWRLWRFTVLPALKPNEPEELPYWIPCKSCLVIA